MCKNHEPLLVTAIFSAVSRSQWKNPIWVFADGNQLPGFPTNNHNNKFIGNQSPKNTPLQVGNYCKNTL